MLDPVPKISSLTNENDQEVSIQVQRVYPQQYLANSELQMLGGAS